MRPTAGDMEQALRVSVDKDASVRALTVKLSAYLSSAYALYEARALGEDLVLAWPVDQGADPLKVAKGMDAIGRAVGARVTGCFPTLSRLQRRALIEAGQAFMTRDGDFYLPQLALSLSRKGPVELASRRPFNPAQQLVFLYCLYAEDMPMSQMDIQERTGLSSGSVSSALALLVGLGLLECHVGGKTGRKKSYRVIDEAEFYREGADSFGSPLRETLTVPTSVVRDGWFRSGLSALAVRSDLLPAEKPVYAVSPAQAKLIPRQVEESLETCTVQVLRYDPAVFAQDGCVDPLTMLLTVGEEDERISIALGQAMGGCEWYQA